MFCGVPTFGFFILNVFKFKFADVNFKAGGKCKLLQWNWFNRYLLTLEYVSTVNC